MKVDSMRNETREARTRSRLARMLAFFVVLIMLIVFNNAAAPAQHGQQGVTKTICRAESVYIYKYPTGQSERRYRLGSGASFRVYHYVNSTWAFGVHNASGVSGYVLREKLCN